MVNIYKQIIMPKRLLLIQIMIKSICIRTQSAWHKMPNIIRTGFLITGYKTKIRGRVSVMFKRDGLKTLKFLCNIMLCS